MCGRYRLTAKERYLRDHFGPGCWCSAANLRFGKVPRLANVY
jgi:hypothetical protein